MTDTDIDTESDDAPSGARMMLEPDSILEHGDELATDCPECGATVSLQQIVEDGHCPNYVAGDEMAAESGTEPVQGPECTAELSLELVWES